MNFNCKGKILPLSHPVVMGILNVTPDSFFAASRANDPAALLQKAEKMLLEGAAILDVGAASTRPGAAEVPEQTERERVTAAIGSLAQHFPEALISVDTWRASVARAAVEAGASIINDISGGQFDANMFPLVGVLRDVPYILMHTQGKPDTMQQNPHYEDVVTEVLDYFIQKIGLLQALGAKDIALDPGFGFGKTLEHNYALLKNLHVFGTVTARPVLVGISRKSMINKVLHTTPETALNGTTALHMAALLQGANIIRAHDVKEAVEVLKLAAYLK